jgi:signal transduction histidine kinase
MMKSIAERVLRVPLVGKLIGANIVIVAAGVLAHSLAASGSRDLDMAIVMTALGVASLVNLILVRVALRPIEELEDLAERVSAGDFDARGVASPFADAGLTRLGVTVNGLLDSLATERKRIQDLGAEVVYAQEAERAMVSRELHDSIAQTLAAARYQLSAASAGADATTRDQLASASGLIASALEEVRNVSYSLHPRVAEDLGIEAALGTLARQVEQRSQVHIDVVTDIVGPPIPRNVAAMMYRVVQEALRNIEVHSKAKAATVEVISREGSIRVDVTDDGCGFDPSKVGTVNRSGLAAVKDRVTLAGGRLKVDSAPNGGTRVTAELNTLKVAS